MKNIIIIMAMCLLTFLLVTQFDNINIKDNKTLKPIITMENNDGLLKFNR